MKNETGESHDNSTGEEGAFYHNESMDLDYFDELNSYFEETSNINFLPDSNHPQDQVMATKLNLNSFFDFERNNNLIIEEDLDKGPEFLNIPELESFFETSPSSSPPPSPAIIHPQSLASTQKHQHHPGQEQYQQKQHYLSTISVTDGMHDRGDGSERLSQLQTLLQTNRQYQQALREQVALVEDARRTIQDHLQTIRSIHGQLIRPRMRPRKEGLLHSGDGSDKLNILAEPSNKIFIRSQVVSFKDLLLNAPAKWNSKECKNLFEGVLHECRRLHLEQNPHVTIDNPNDLFTRYFTGIDWNKIAMAFVTSRTAIDCRLQWTNQQHPLIDHTALSNAETIKLIDLVNNKQGNSQGKWTIIANDISPRRTAWQCLGEYRRHQVKSFTSVSREGQRLSTGRKWTPEEDQILLECRRLYGASSDWWLEAVDRLTSHHRTAAQVLHRWNKALNPDKRIGRWTALEDAWLLLAVHRVGGNTIIHDERNEKMIEKDKAAEENIELNRRTINWSVVSAFVPRRTDVQCRERYMNVLHPFVRKDDFTMEEDNLLRRAVKELGEGNWAAIQARHFPNRTDNQCRRRWMVLAHDIVDVGETKHSKTPQREQLSSLVRKSKRKKTAETAKPVATLKKVVTPAPLDRKTSRKRR